MKRMEPKNQFHGKAGDPISKDPCPERLEENETEGRFSIPVLSIQEGSVPQLFRPFFGEEPGRKARHSEARVSKKGPPTKSIQ